MEIKTILLSVAALLIVQVPPNDSAKILALFTSHSRSHVIIHMAVAKALIQSGHNLTVVTTIDLNESQADQASYRHVQLPGSDISGTVAKVMKMSGFEVFLNFYSVLRSMMENSRVALKSDAMQQLMAEESFDLVLLGYFVNEYEVGVAAHFKCPIVLSWMISTFYGTNTLVGNPHEIAHVPNVMWGMKTSSGFVNRLQNFIFHIVDRILWIAIRYNYNIYYEEIFPPSKYPSYEEARKNIALVLSNSHLSQDPIRANVPAVVEIGGISIDDEPNPLPKDIQTFLDSAGEDGAIFFSLGSNMRSVDLQEDAIKAIYEVLSSLKQKVIWKWESDAVPGTASNIKFQKWLPQNSVLAHPNLKLFITHGGKGSVVESKFYGVPMLGLPFLGDQPTNINEMVANGYGLALNHRTLSAVELKQTIDELLTNPKYREAVQQFRALFTDRPMTPKQTAVFWIEYVLRHKGAKHLQSPAVHMADYELLGIDVMAFLLVLLYVLYRLIKFMFRCMFSLCCRRKSKVTVNDKKKF